MNLKSVSLLSLAAFGLLASCAAPLSENETRDVSTIGVVNSFPENPHIRFTGTTVFNNRESTVPDSTFKRQISNETAKYLRTKGYDVKSDSSIEDLRSGRVQMVIQLIPVEVFGKVGTYGYGFYHQSFGGSTQGPQSYVAMSVTPIRHEKLISAGHYKDSFKPLPFKNLPTTWEKANVKEQAVMRDSLHANISVTTRSLLDKLGLPDRK